MTVKLGGSSTVIRRRKNYRCEPIGLPDGDLEFSANSIGREKVLASARDFLLRASRDLTACERFRMPRSSLKKTQREHVPTATAFGDNDLESVGDDKEHLQQDTGKYLYYFTYADTGKRSRLWSKEADADC
jgi:hypothetical protein